MPERKLCPDCGSGLGASATKCRCGWTYSGNVVAFMPRIDCSFSGCSANAICRVFTKTGWAKVCMNHYERIEKLSPPHDSPLVPQIRAAYEKSVAYRQKQAGLDSAFDLESKTA